MRLWLNGPEFLSASIRERGFNMRIIRAVIDRKLDWQFTKNPERDLGLDKDSLRGKRFIVLKTKGGYGVRDVKTQKIIYSSYEIDDSLDFAHYHNNVIEKKADRGGGVFSEFGKETIRAAIPVILTVGGTIAWAFLKPWLKSKVSSGYDVEDSAAESEYGMDSPQRGIRIPRTPRMR